MNGHLPVSEKAAKSMRKTRTTARKKTTTGRKTRTSSNGRTSDPPSAGTLARTKTLLLAALRVWELKHRVSID